MHDHSIKEKNFIKMTTTSYAEKLLKRVVNIFSNYYSLAA